MKPGDTFVIKSIDRNYGDILEQWHIITKEKESAIVVLDIPLLDTQQKNRDLTGIFIADLVSQILSYVAQTKRELIRQRQAKGLESAKEKGVKLGRPSLEKPEIFFEVMQAWKNSEISTREAGRRLGVSYRTFLTWADQNISE
ncbi:MAG: recombinase family protein [Sporomusaceae bacterium]|nr:recombinase family protein [Sporomusaceae bacterium]